ncbi:MAG: hypothetical protein IJB97_02155 [Clostridia bacterium]|nr:hypothetical protein [Clostridia bacterium]
MNAYILSVLGIVLFSSMITVMIPDGKTAGFIKGIARLVCVFAIVAPLINFFQNGAKNGNGENIFLNSVIKTDEAYIDYCSKISIKTAEKQVIQTVEKEYGIACEIQFQWQYAEKTTDGLNGFFLVHYEGKAVKVTEIQIRFPSETPEETQNEIIRRIQTDTGCEVTTVA